MKRFFLYSVLSSFLLLSCQDINEVEKPDDLIGEEKMTDILYDLALIDAAMSTSRIKVSGKNLDPKSYIFSKYDIDSARLARSNAYYLQQIDINLRMYEEVRERLQERKKILDSLEFIEDSLRRKELKPDKTDSIGKSEQKRDKLFKILPKPGKKLPTRVPMPEKDTLN